MARMADKVALVFGGAKGIGLAAAGALVEAGATVVLTGRREAEVQAAAQRIGAQGLVADACVPADLARVVAQVTEAHGGIDALVLNAGISEPALLTEQTVDHFDRHFTVNVGSALFGLQAAQAAMGDGAAAVVVGSIADVMGYPPYGTYAATKAALRSYTRSWAKELAPRGIRVNIVAPAPTDTEMMAAVSEEDRRALVEPILLGRMARPAEVAAAILFLLSDEASFITGTELCVDGGMKQV